MIAIHTIFKGEKGFVLPVGLMFLGILCVLGSTALVVTITDNRIGANQKAKLQARYSAIGGYEEARARLGSIGQVGTLDANWRRFVGDAASVAGIFDYDAGNSDHHLSVSLQTDSIYAVMIRHKTDASGNVILWGDSDGDYVFEENLSEGYPIEIISSSGIVGSAKKTITVVVVKQVQFFNPPAAIYVNGNLVKESSAGGADGNYNPACEPMPDIVTTINAGSCPLENCEASDWIASTGASTWLVDDGNNIYPVTTVVNQLGNIADNTIPPGSYTNPPEWGSVESPYEITYCNGDLEVVNINGLGILVVSGDLTLKGNIAWYGMVIVKGTTTMHGGGNTIGIRGAFIADSSVIIMGHVSVSYDCDTIRDLENNVSEYEVYSWKDHSIGF